MAEKRGHTVKLLNPFPIEKPLEVELNGKWYRTISKDFRSWTGKRRIAIGYDEQGNAIHEEYNGPVFQEGTNKTI